MGFQLYFDMDGTLADLYGVDNWLKKLKKSDPSPFECAAPMHNMDELSKMLNLAQGEGAELYIVSWLPKGASPTYKERVAKAKREWLKRVLPLVEWDDIYILPYGTPKYKVYPLEGAILFDDEERNRIAWEKQGNRSLSPEEIFSVFKNFI